MNRRWAARAVDPSAQRYLEAVRSQGPVALIAIPRSQLQCRLQRDLGCVEADSSLDDFDHVPLTDDAGHEITGIYVQGTGRVELSESMFMSADAPLVDFLETADRQRFRLLVDGGAVTGMVTLSDLQKLPVYGLLFGMVVAVELLLMDWLRQSSLGQPDAWLQHLGPRQRGIIEQHWRNATQQDLAVDKLELASLGQEIQAAASMGLFDGEEEKLRDMKRLKGLRDLVCHAAEFAPTAEHALRIPAMTRSAQALATWLNLKIPRSAP